MSHEKAADPRRPTFVELLRIDLGDDELIVRQFSDGVVTLEHSEPRLLLNERQWREVLIEFVKLANPPNAITGQHTGDTDEEARHTAEGAPAAAEDIAESSDGH
jgi:hypothetical protein